MPILRPDCCTPSRHRWNHPSVVGLRRSDNDVSEGSVDFSMRLVRGHMLYTPPNPNPDALARVVLPRGFTVRRTLTSLTCGTQRRAENGSGTHTAHTARSRWTATVSQADHCCVASVCEGCRTHAPFTAKRTVAQGVTPGQPPIRTARSTAGVAHDSSNRLPLLAIDRRVDRHACRGLA